MQDLCCWWCINGRLLESSQRCEVSGAMAAHAAVYRSISPLCRLSFFLPSAVGAFSPPHLLPAFLPLFTPTAEHLLLLCLTSEFPSQYFGSSACPKIVPAALWPTDPSSSLNGPVWSGSGLWKECLRARWGMGHLEVMERFDWIKIRSTKTKKKYQKYHQNQKEPLLFGSFKPIGWDEQHVFFLFI